MARPSKSATSLQSLGRALEVFARQTRAVLPIRHMLVFLDIAQHEGQTPAQLAKRLDVSSSAMTRIVQELGAWNRKAEPGYRLVDYDVQLNDRRFKPVVLTAKGRALAASIAEALAI